MKKTIFDIVGLTIWLVVVVAVCNWLNAPQWVMWGLPIVICGGAVITWVTRLARWAAKRPRTS